MSIYKRLDVKDEILQLYQEKLDSLQVSYQEIDVKTSFGNTHVIKIGSPQGRKIVLFHGINAGAPVALEAVKNLSDEFEIFAIDTIGQATKSDEKVLDIYDASYANWADEVVSGLGLAQADFIGVSYGAYILQKLITHKPERVGKCVFVVPSGLVNGSFFRSMKELSFPLMRFLVTKKDKHLKSFLKSFVPEEDDFMFRLQREILLGVKMDYRRPALLKEEDVAHFQNPVYMIVADDDVFFPGKEAVDRAKKIFKNLQEVYFLPNCKHMPSHEHYPVFQSKIRSWLR